MSPKEKLKVLRKIVAEYSAGKIDGMLVDMISASRVLGLYERLGPEGGEKLLSMPVLEMVAEATG